MYLFEEKNGKINVFSFEPKVNDVKSFKMTEMAKMPKEPLVFQTIEFVIKGDKPIFSGDFNGENEKGYYTAKEVSRVEFLPCEKSGENLVLKEFYDGNLVDTKNPHNLVRIKRGENNSQNPKYKHFLVGYSSYKSEPSPISRNYSAFKVLRLPKSLYLLSALEQGKFKLVEDANIKRQLDLFKVQQVDVLPLYHVLATDLFGITENAQENLTKAIEKSKPLIKTLKAQERI